jgi:tetratricopeptide (TPR) repeat protein
MVAMKKLLIFLLVGLPARLFAQTPTIDSLRAELQKINPPAKRATLAHQIAFQMIDVNLDSALQWADKVVAYSKTGNDFKNLAAAWIVRGHGFWRKGEHVKGLEAFNEALSIAKEHKLDQEQARALVGVGSVYNYLGDYNQSLLYYRQAQAIAEQAAFNRILPGVYSNIAGIYNNLNNFKESLKYREKAVQFSVGENIDRLPASLSNLGRLYTDIGEHRKGLHYLFRALHLIQRESCSELYVIENIGYTYLKLGMIDSARYYTNVGLQKTKRCNEVIPAIDLLSTLGEIETADGHGSIATRYLTQALQKGLKIKAMRESTRAARLLADAYEQAKQYQLALAAQKKYKSLSDSLFGLDQLTAFSKQEASIEFQLIQKNQEMAKRIEDFKREEEIRTHVKIRNTLIVGFAIALTMSISLYYYYRRRKRYSQKLEQLNREIQDQKEEVVQLNHTLSAINNSLEAKIAERTKEIQHANELLVSKNKKLEEYVFYNAHKLRGPVSTILGLIELFSNPLIKEKDVPEVINKLKESTTKLDSVVREIQGIVKTSDSNP